VVTIVVATDIIACMPGHLSVHNYATCAQLFSSIIIHDPLDNDRTLRSINLPVPTF